MKRNFKLVLVTAVLALSLVLTITRREPQGFTLGAGDALRAAPQGKGGSKTYDLAALRIFNSALMHINDSYVDPTRVDPKQMLLSALDQVQKSVAEVLVEPQPDRHKVVVRVDTAQREFVIDDVDSPWTLSLKMREIFRFIQQHLQPGTGAKDLEYAATNGMLSTLDPHSVLLDPTLYQEMTLNTRGHFGGLGIVISIRKGQLTVMKAMKGTPAEAAGIKAGDKIVKIEKQSTVNMMLNDAVNRLRGDPETKVEVWTQRGEAASRKIVLTRAVIHVNTVEAHYLKNNIGYVKLSQFSGNSADELRRALEEMKSKGPLKGIVLDMRDDPGGLLDRAIQITDEFVEGGTIVTTVGYANKQREEKRAAPGNQPHVPMAVLVNGGSASASEIVAGALKNLDRAVILGSRTFGKGSVQVLYDNDDGSALKLTIAQYLTPGDVSIQSVGIMPDILLEPAELTKERVSIFRPSHNLREQDLDAHLTSRNAQDGEKPSETVRFLSDQAKRKGQGSILRDDMKPSEDPEEAEPEEEPIVEGDRFTEDYEIIFARELLAQAKGWRRREVLASSRPFLDRKLAEEQAKIAEAMKKFGVEWTAVPSGPIDLVAELTSDRPNNEVAAGGTITLQAKVTNRGTNVASQVRGITKCDDPLLSDREFVFGRIAPGESRTWSVPIKIDRSALTRIGEVRLEVSDGRQGAITLASPPAVQVKIAGLQRPRFAYAYQLIDDVKGNGDGLVQRGEEVRLHVTVKNIGDGKAYKTLATLSNKSGEGIDVVKGRFNVDNLQPGEDKAVDFTFSVGELKEETFALQMDVYDQVLHEYISEKLSFPIAAAPLGMQSATATVAITGDVAVNVHAGASATTPIIGHVGKGAVLKSTARIGDFYRVEIETGRPAFVAAAAIRQEEAGKPAPSFTANMQVTPPRLAVTSAPLAVNGPSFRLSAAATDDQQVSDGFVFVTNRAAKIDHRKVFYRSNRGGTTPKELRFDADVPLWPGVNQVTVIARQSNQVQSQQTLIVVRPPSSDNKHAVKEPAAEAR